MDFYQVDRYGCEKCEKPFDRSYVYCPYCGKKVRKPKPVKKKFAWLKVVPISILVCLAIFVGHLIASKEKLDEIKNKAFEAMNNQNFREAKEYMDQYPDAESQFAVECAYINAGISMEEGNILEALDSFRKLNYPVPTSIMDTLVEKVYHLGTVYYHGLKLPEAKVYFDVVRDYKRSEDYLALIKAQVSYSRTSYEELVKLIGFENTEDILLSRMYSDLFLCGTWRTTNKSHYFIMRNDESISCNIPSITRSTSYVLENGIGIDNATEKSRGGCFSISVIDENTIDILCYKNGEKYRMYRE